MAPKTPSTPTKKARRRAVPRGRAYIQSTQNNTIITITDEAGAPLCRFSAGAAGFKGPRKATPHAAQIAAETAAARAKVFSMENVDVLVKGTGPARDQAIRSLQISGLSVQSITDLTPLPHGGCRQRRPRKV